MVLMQIAQVPVATAFGPAIDTSVDRSRMSSVSHPCALGASLPIVPVTECGPAVVVTVDPFG